MIINIHIIVLDAHITPSSTSNLKDLKIVPPFSFQFYQQEDSS